MGSIMIQEYDQADVGLCDLCSKEANQLSWIGGDWVCEGCVRFG